jgi:hypothetical protein
MATSFAASGHTDEAYTPEQVIVGASDVITRPETYAAGADVAALTVMGRVTASGKLIPSVSTAVDGSEKPVAIAVEAVAAAAADKVGPAYIAGEFNVDALVWDASWTTDAQKLASPGDGQLVFKKLAYSAV